MTRRVLATALVTLLVAACGGEERITGPASPVRPMVLNAIGSDPVTGATIETNQDDYAPGEVVHLVGRGWKPGEVVHLFMTESPERHEDIASMVQADSVGAFSTHFYDVQEHDLGVTFTLTGTGQSSGSVVTVVFTDSRILTAIELRDPATLTFLASPNQVSITAGADVTIRATGTTDGLGGGGAAADDWESTSWAIRGPAPSNGLAASGCSSTINVTAATIGAQHIFTVTAPASLAGGTYAVEIRAFRSNGCVESPSNALTYANGLVVVPQANAAPALTAIGDKDINEGSELTFTATATDTDTPVQTLTFSLVGAPAGATIDPSTGAFSWTPSDGPAQTATFTVRVTDNGTPAMSAEEEVTVTVNNVAPTATFNAPTAVSGGSSINLSLTAPVDPSTDDATAGFSYAFDCGDGAGYSTPAGTSTASCPTSGTGSRTVKGKIIDKDGGATEYSASVAINNVAPTAEANGPYSGDEGSSIAISGAGNDPDGGSVTYAWSVTGAACSFANASAASTTVTCNDNGTFTLTLTVTDDENASTTDDAQLTVDNVAPIATFNAPASVPEGSSINLSLTSVIDPSTADVAAGFTYAFDCGAGYGSFGAASTASCPTTDNGTRTVKGTVQDKDGGTSEYSASVTITNVPPAVNIGAATATINEGGTFSRAGSFTDPGADSWTGTVDYGNGSGPQPLTLNPDKTFSLSHTYPQDGSFTITVTVSDDDGGSDTETIALTVNNVLPTVNAGPDVSILEGATFSQGGSFTDPGADTWSATVDYGDGSGTQPLTLNGKNLTLSHVYADNVGSPFTVTVTVLDDDGSSTDIVTVAVANVPPSITGVVATPIAAGNIYPITQPVTVSAAFTDPGTVDTHSCSSKAVALNVPEVNAGPSAATGNSCANTLSFASAGVYDVTITVTDKDGGSDNETIQVIVYDPSAGFVTGGGWINSPAGAYYADPSLAGKATFGFVAKYKKGASVPEGNTQFVFHAGGFNFHSAEYEFLIVNQNGTNAQYKGTGTVNGASGYSFMLWAKDGSPDQLRIKIWETATNAVVYDNLLGGADGEVQAIANGSIVIHAPKK